MGGGSSHSESAQQTVTNTTTEVTTNTSTDIGEIGLTGNDAVAIADIVNTAGVEMQRIQSKNIETIIQMAGNSWNQLVGGASQLVRTSEAASDKLLQSSKEIASPQIAAQENLTANIKWGVVAIAVIGGAMILSTRRK